MEAALSDGIMSHALIPFRNTFILSLCRNYVEPALMFVVESVYQEPAGSPQSLSECSGEALDSGQGLHTAPTVSISTESCTEGDNGTLTGLV